MSVIFYTTPAHRDELEVQNVSSNAATKINLIDNTLKTSWSPTAADVSGNNQCHIVIDTYEQDATAYAAGKGKTSGSFESFGVWLNNYDTDFSSAYFAVYHSYTTTFTEVIGDNITWLHLDGPLFFADLTTPATKRYVQIVIKNLSEVPKIGAIKILKKRTVQTTEEYPKTYVDEFYNKHINLSGGEVVSIIESYNYTSRITSKYHFISTANYDAMKNMFRDSLGGTRWLIYQPGTAVTDAYLCRILSDMDDVQEVNHHFWEANLTMRSIAYTKDGDSI